MTLGARVLVLKCMIFLTMTLILNTIYISTDKLDPLQKFVNEFLWRGCNRLPPDICQNTPNKGGLNHLHVKHYIHNLRVKWMTQLWSDTTRT